MVTMAVLRRGTSTWGLMAALGQAAPGGRCGGDW